MIIKNGLVYNENGDFEKRDIYVEGEFITDKAPEDCEVIDAEGLYVIPGLVDVHTHGAVGHDFCDADLDGLYKIAEFEKSKGVTAFCPTSMTLSEELLTGIFAKINDFKPEKKHARVLGINMEGPFISPKKMGAQNPKYIMNSDVEVFRRLNEVSGGNIRLVTLAPETEGANLFI